ncbi:MAG: TMEM165/GDT1 family protein [Nitrospinae bacterium]|nr:TMEM165/GDT1 family protein [Nitrospinota bacterium]
MEWKIIGSVFMMVFFAELGDKTQLATMACAGCEQSKMSVFLGSALALVTASALATLVGAAIAQTVPAAYLNRLAGAMFITFGLFYLIRP